MPTVYYMNWIIVYRQFCNLQAVVIKYLLGILYVSYDFPLHKKILPYIVQVHANEIFSFFSVNLKNLDNVRCKYQSAEPSSAIWVWEGLKKISYAATYIKFELSKNKICTYQVILKMLGGYQQGPCFGHIWIHKQGNSNLNALWIRIICRIVNICTYTHGLDYIGIFLNWSDSVFLPGYYILTNLSVTNLY